MPVCNPMYQEPRTDGVMAHLELDPRTGGTVLVPDTACKDAEPCIVCGAPILQGIGHDKGCALEWQNTADTTPAVSDPCHPAVRS